MKIKFVFLILLFSFPIFGQTNAELNQKIDRISLKVKSIDSLANYEKEEVELGEIKMAHGRIDEKPIRQLYTNTRIAKSSNKIIRICYRERYPNYDEDLNLYYLDNKLIYAERTRWKGNRNKFSMENFYFENDMQISGENSKKYPTEGIDILIRAEELIKQASR
jgi:hypothetical protein